MTINIKDKIKDISANGAYMVALTNAIGVGQRVSLGRLAEAVRSNPDLTKKIRHNKSCVYKRFKSLKDNNDSGHICGRCLFWLLNNSQNKTRFKVANSSGFNPDEIIIERLK